KIADAIPPVVEESLPPVVKIVSPTHKATYSGPKDIEIKVVAEGKGCDIKKVEFYSGDKLWGTAHSAPYVYLGSNVQPGEYTITAKATDVNAQISVSEAVLVLVDKPIEDTKPVEVVKP